MSDETSEREAGAWVSSAFAHLVGEGPDGESVSEKPRGEELIDRVLRVVRDIPSGRTMTYGDIGALVGCGPRQVGRILSTMQETVPWWRVTNASGLLPEPLRAEAVEHYDVEGTVRRGEGVRLAVSRWRPE